jgi:hypothetical protein
MSASAETKTTALAALEIESPPQYPPYATLSTLLPPLCNSPDANASLEYKELRCATAQEQLAQLRLTTTT